MTEHFDEAPLIVQEPLIATRPKRALRRPFHWIVFACSAAVGVTPVVAGLVFGAAGIIGTVRFEAMPLWAAGLSVMLIAACLIGAIVVIFGVTEADNEATWLGLGFSVLAWPGVIMAALLLTVTAPSANSTGEETPMYAVTIEDLI